MCWMRSWTGSIQEMENLDSFNVHSDTRGQRVANYKKTQADFVVDPIFPLRPLQNPIQLNENRKWGTCHDHFSFSLASIKCWKNTHKGGGKKCRLVLPHLKQPRWAVMPYQLQTNPPAKLQWLVMATCLNPTILSQGSRVGIPPGCDITILSS